MLLLQCTTSLVRWFGLRWRAGSRRRCRPKTAVAGARGRPSAEATSAAPSHSFIQGHSGGWQTLHAAYPFALASFRLIGILLAAKYRHPSR
jgi:hypothetical protein